MFVLSFAYGHWYLIEYNTYCKLMTGISLTCCISSIMSCGLRCLTSHQSSVANQSAAVAEVTSLSSEKTTAAKVSTTKKRTSQAELLAGAVKRKK